MVAEIDTDALKLKEQMWLKNDKKNLKQPASTQNELVVLKQLYLKIKFICHFFTVE